MAVALDNADADAPRAKLRQHALDERRLARTHGGVEGKDGKGTVGGAVVQSEMGYELSGSLANLSEGFDDDVHDDIL